MRNSFHVQARLWRDDGCSVLSETCQFRGYLLAEIRQAAHGKDLSMPIAGK
jgi:hypothetical protein